MNSLADFRQVYLEHQAFIRAVLYRLVGPEQLDDAVQETFLKAWKGRMNFRGDSSVKTWLHTIATRTAIDSYGNKEIPSEFMADTGVEDKDPTTGDDINKAVWELPMEYRVVVVSVIFEELSLKETAASLKIPEGTVKSRLSRGRELLQSKLRLMGYDYE
jgi:RNA polymerase sigma-70 factor (ECF subfamily)